MTNLSYIAYRPRTSNLKKHGDFINLSFIHCRMPRRKCFTVDEAAAYIMEEEIPDDDGDEPEIIVIPPVPDGLTDEENIDDEDMDDRVNELDPGQDIAGTIEVQIPSKLRPTSKKVKNKEKTKWTKGNNFLDFSAPVDEYEKKEKIQCELGGLCEDELFLKFFDDEVLQLIKVQSELYAHQQNRLNFRLPIHILKRFLGFLLFSGYHRLPREEMYWENAEDSGISLIRSALTRQEYRDAKRNIHFADNDTPDKEDKMYKLRQLFVLLNNKFSQFGVFEKNLSIDEQMVPYFGRHSSKMFMKGKPVRFGFKLWCLCSSHGYLFKCIPYCGKTAHFDPDLGLGGSVVMQLLEIVETPSAHTVHFDNFFTSHALLVSLKSYGFFATGTIRENRLSGGCFIDNKELKEQGRGAYDCISDTNNGILAVKWFDNSAVCIATNFEPVEPVRPVRRFSRKEKQHVNISQPFLINSYNQHMGGVDLHDNFVAKYRVRVKGKKWWWPLFVNMLDSAVVNAWRIHRSVGKTDDLLSFRRKVAIKLLKTKVPVTMIDQEPHHNRTGRPSMISEISRPSMIQTNHTIVRNSKRLRCRHCKSQTIFMCNQCKIGLHPRCFNNFH